MSARSIRWPMAVYFDASVLRELPYDLASPDLARLKAVAERLDIGLFVPEVAAREWIIHHQDIVRKEYQQVGSSSRTVGKYLRREPLGFETLRIEDSLEDVSRIQRSYLDSADIEVVAQPTVDVAVLLDMALRYERPFERGDKGFRDTLIALTIAEHAKQFGGSYILVVAKDKVFRSDEVGARWRGAGVEPLVASSLSEAVEQLDRLIDEAVKAYFDEQTERIRGYLATQGELIFSYVVKNAEVSEAFIKGFGSAEYFGTLRRIRAMRPLEITGVSRGTVTGDIEEKSGRVPITFKVKVAFDITVSAYDLGDLLGPRYKVVGPVDVSSMVGLSAALAQPAEQDLTVEREITVEASVAEDKGQYADLRIEKLLTF